MYVYKETFPKRRTWFNINSLVRILSIPLTVLKMVHLWLLIKGQ